MKKINSNKRISTLKRSTNRMSKHIRALLVEKGVLEQYKARPPYQQNDYLGWIAGAKQEETKQKRIHQMLDELKKGDRYMKMSWRGSK